MVILKRRASPDFTTGLADRVRALAEAVEACEGRVAAEPVAEARRVVKQVDQRLAFTGSITVVALAGATGSGKSSIFNGLSGTDLARVGVRRPTTSAPLAATWGDEPTEDLLDWLQVTRRHAVNAGGLLDGLVLLDLPDHDSTEISHRLQADRLVQLVDVLVWVVDPQKYA
ncbi:MAG: 50S ribosome-binding GTPase, partial [Microlunatus sp.]|nr:50S ribosome-binding GTPase [Microlunatus sp.]